MRHLYLIALSLLWSTCATLTSAADRRNEHADARPLPSGFVRIRDVEPGIIEDMRYATPRNFTGQRVPGYRAGRCILARPVAQALARVHRRLIAQGFAIKVYDCYRPARAVRSFVRWADGVYGLDQKFYYPRIRRDRTIALGYIAERSSHSLGTAIDLTIVRVGDTTAEKGSSGQERPPIDQASCITAKSKRPFDTSVDMGTSWDCFDVRSHTRNQTISDEAKRNRDMLVSAMRSQGFRNYSREWWHFSMPLRAFQQARDFPVE